MSDNMTKEDGIHLGEFVSTFEAKGLDEGFSKLEEYFRDYPDREKFLYCAIEFLASAVALKEYSPEKYKQYTEKVISYLEKLGKTDDIEVRTQVSLKLFYIAMEQKDYDKDAQIISKVEESDNEDIALAKAELLMKTNQADMAAQIMEKQLLSALTSVKLILVKLAKAEATAGETEKANKIAEIYQNAIELFGLKKYESYKAAIEVALANKDADECLSVIDKSISDFSQPRTPEKSPLFFRGNFKDTSEYYREAVPTFIAALENRPEAAFLRENENYKKLIDKYRAK